MIYEYALEPTVLSTWASNNRDYAEFLREYGVGTPRIVSSFPKKNVAKLRSYLLQHSPQDSQSLSGRRYVEMVTKLAESIVIRGGADHNASAWSKAAVIENNRAPFDVILSSSVIDVVNNVTPESMYLQGSAWNHFYQLNVQRTNAGFLSVIANLVRLSTKQIAIIDPFGWSAEAIVFTQFMINSIPNNRLADEYPKITLFFKEKRGGANAGSGSPSAHHVKSQVLQGLNREVERINFEVFELREAAGGDVFHNRCILTEHGGVITGHGIGVSGSEAHTDEAILMNSEIYQKKWHSFLGKNCYDVVSTA